MNMILVISFMHMRLTSKPKDFVPTHLLNLYSSRKILLPVYLPNQELVLRYCLSMSFTD